MYIIKKVLVIGLLVCVTLQSSLLSVLAKTEVNNLYVLTESGNKIEVTKYTVNGYEQIRLVDHEGNYLEFGTDDDFFEYNGETVEFQTHTEVLNYRTGFVTSLFSSSSMLNYAVVNYVKVQTTTTKYTVSKAISQFSADLFGLFLNWKLGLAIAVYNFIVNAYSTPNLQLSKIMYIRSDKYAYLPILSQFYYHSYALDPYYVKIPNTDNFDNAGLKAFLGY